MRGIKVLATTFVLAACAASTPPIERDWSFQGFEVAVGFQDAPMGGCAIQDAVLVNRSERPLNAVYTQLIVTNQAGITVGQVGINFMATMPGGRTQAAHVDYTGLGGRDCDSFRFNLTAR